VPTATRTSRRIIVLAIVGLLMALIGGGLGGAFRLAPPYGLRWGEALWSAGGLTGCVGLALLLLSPVLGLAWTVVGEGAGARRRRGDPR